MTTVENTPELMAKWEPTSGIVGCACGMAIIADGTPNQFSREIVAHGLSHTARLVEAEGAFMLAKFLAETHE